MPDVIYYTNNAHENSLESLKKDIYPMFATIYIVFVLTFRSLEVFFTVFERNLLCSPRLHLFGNKYSKNSIIL